MLTTDQIRLLECHASRYPDAEITQAVIAWYNAEYAALGEIEPYEVCEPCEEGGTVETIEDALEAISGLLTGDTRQVGRATIRIICREARRQNIIRTAPQV